MKKLAILFIGIILFISNLFSQSDKILWYKQPALHFEESLVIGNGKLGATVPASFRKCGSAYRPQDQGDSYRRWRVAKQAAESAGGAGHGAPGDCGPRGVYRHWQCASASFRIGRSAKLGSRPPNCAQQLPCRRGSIFAAIMPRKRVPIQSLKGWMVQALGSESFPLEGPSIGHSQKS